MSKKSKSTAKGIKLGFWLGLAHRILILMGLIYGFANSKYTIYQKGIGFDYDVGFIMGVIIFLVIIL